LCCYDKLSTDYARYCTYLFLLTAAPLVKPIPFQPCDPSVAGPDIFQRLIPMEAHTDSSLYRSEVISLSTVIQLYICKTFLQKNTKDGVTHTIFKLFCASEVCVLSYGHCLVNIVSQSNHVLLYRSWGMKFYMAILKPLWEVVVYRVSEPSKKKPHLDFNQSLVN